MTGPVALPLPTAMPPCETGEIVHRDYHVLVWAHTGAGAMRAGDATYRIEQGQALWIPARVPHQARSDEGSIPLPLHVPAGGALDLPDQPTLITVPDSWTDWLIYCFGGRGTHSETRGLLAPADDVDIAHRCQPSDIEVNLPMPHSPAALDVARALHHHPALQSTAAEWARQVRVSLRTLQMQFLDETGITFAAWRTRNRLLAAAELLRDGHDIVATAHQVGYRTHSGFTTAFGAHFQMTPGQYARTERRASHGESRAAGRSSRAEGVTRLAALLAGTAGAPPPIPARPERRGVNDFHVVLWAYRGPVRIRTGAGGQRTWMLRTGDVFFLPAGVPYNVWNDEGGILLPIGEQHGVVPLGDDDVAVISLGDEHETLLLYTHVITYTIRRPVGYDHDATAVTRFFDAFAARRRERTLTMPAMVDARRIALAVNTDPGNRRDLSEWAAKLSVDVDPAMLQEAFVAETGQRFDRWHAQLRMRVAKDLILDGTPNKVVARRLGYTNLSTFCHAFRRAHGAAPGEYLRRHRARRVPSPS